MTLFAKKKKKKKKEKKILKGENLGNNNIMYLLLVAYYSETPPKMPTILIHIKTSIVSNTKFPLTDSSILILIKTLEIYWV